jgi:hypothetical protein
VNASDTREDFAAVKNIDFTNFGFNRPQAGLRD